MGWLPGLSDRKHVRKVPGRRGRCSTRRGRTAAPRAGKDEDAERRMVVS